MKIPPQKTGSRRQKDFLQLCSTQNSQRSEQRSNCLQSREIRRTNTFTQSILAECQQIKKIMCARTQYKSLSQRQVCIYLSGPKVQGDQKQLWQVIVIIFVTWPYWGIEISKWLQISFPKMVGLYHFFWFLGFPEKNCQRHNGPRNWLRDLD